MTETTPDSPSPEGSPQKIINTPTTYDMWGPVEPKKIKPVGMGDVLLGFFYSLILFGALPAALILSLLTLDQQSKNQSTAETEQQITAFTENPLFILVFLILSWIGFLLAVWIAGTRKGDKNIKKLINWGFRWKQDIIIAILFTIVFRGIEISTSVLLKQFGIDTSTLSNSSFLLEQSGIWLALIILGALFGAPLVEEIFFRGLFLTVAVRNWGKTVGVIISSAAFGILHLQTSVDASIYTVISTSILGASLAILVLKTKRLGSAIVSHVVFNASGVALVLITTYYM